MLTRVSSPFLTSNDIRSCSFAVVPRNLQPWGSVFVKVRIEGSRRLHWCSSSSLKRIEAMDGNSITGMVAVEETMANAAKVEPKIVVDDPDSIERMTVEQLRVKLRSVGLPAKGIKRDLVASLKDFLNNNVDEGDSLVKDDSKSSDKAVCTDKVYHRRKTKSLPAGEQGQGVNTASEVSAIQHTKRRIKLSKAESSFEEVQSTAFIKKQKLSDKFIKVSGKKSSAVKVKATPEVASVAVEALSENTLSPTQTEPWTIFAHKKPQKGWVVYNPRTMRPPPLSCDTRSVRLLSWNVNGLRALLKLEGFSALQLAKRENFDVLCLQETKLQEKDVEAIKQSLLDGYDNSFWTCSSAKLGYSGTAIISRIKPLSVKYGLGISDHDSEGRLVTVEFETFYLLCAYVPNSGDGLRRLSYRVTEWDISLSNYMKELEKSKPVILTGDLNCAHEEIDIYNPAGNKRSAGFTVEERQSFSTNFLSKGFVDTFREQHPGVVGYTYWGYRHSGRKTNKGWRLDYFLVSKSIADKVHDSYILPDVTGSDHCPIGLVLKL